MTSDQTADALQARLAALEARLDHFEIYDFVPVDVGYSVTLKDQFDEGPADARLRQLDHLLNPVSKALPNRRPPALVDEFDHYLLYRAGSESYVDRLVCVFNQFGRQEYRLGRPVRLIVPAEKVEPGSSLPQGRDIYKVYQILSAENIDQPVTLRDQFGTLETVVREPRFFCVPAKQQRESDREWIPINDEEAHLTIYGIDPNPVQEPRQVIDQFGSQDIEAVLSVMLAVPTLKLSFQQRTFPD